MSQYPERPPQDLSPLATSKFTFSASAGERTRRESQAQLKRLEDRINEINDNFKVTFANGGGQGTLIDKILAVTHDRDELKGVAKGLDRVAELIAAHAELAKRVQVLELAEKDPTWFNWAFGDFSDEVDSDISRLETLGNNEP